MAVMVLSPQRRQIYDSIRKKWVDALPEEVVRQKILSHLVNQLGYPTHAIVVERKLSELPQVSEKKVPSRRIDILCLESETLHPLLLIECKAVALQEKMFAQALGYNAYIKAPLICLANDEGFLLRWENDSSIKERNQLPTYESLKNAR
jgi:hypothetical protein